MKNLAVFKVELSRIRCLCNLLGDKTEIMLYNIESTYSFILELKPPAILAEIIFILKSAALPGFIALIIAHPLNLYQKANRFGGQ